MSHAILCSCFKCEAKQTKHLPKEFFRDISDSQKETLAKIMQNFIKSLDEEDLLESNHVFYSLNSHLDALGFKLCIGEMRNGFTYSLDLEGIPFIYVGTKSRRRY